MMLAVLKKELACYAGSPVMYVTCTVFIGIAGYLFYGNLIMLLLLQGSSLPLDLWEFTVNDIRLLVMLLIPVVSMRIIAEEKRLGTIELLFTSPLSEWNIVLGKYLAGMCIIGLFVCITFLYPCLFSIFYPIDLYPIMAAYAGIMLLCFAIAAAGVFLSALTTSQIIAAVSTAGFSFFLWFIDQNAAADQTLASRIFASLSLQKHFYNFNRGVVTLRDIVYFAGFSVFFILLTVDLLKLRTRETATFQMPWLGALNVRWLPCAARAGVYILFFTVCILQPGIPALRLDLTAGRIHSPSDMTQAAFDRLQSPFILTVGCEGLQKYQYEDFFEQLAALSSYFDFRLVSLEQNPVAAARMDITEPGSGFIEYNGRIKRIEKTNEESIVAAIYDLTRVDPGKVTVLTQVRKAPEEGPVSFALADSILQGQGLILKIADQHSRGIIDSDTKLLIMRNCHSDITENILEAIDTFFVRGGSVLMLLEPGEMPRAARFLKQYNIELGNDLIIDREHGGSGFDELTPVIFFNKEHPATADCTAPAVFNRVRSVQVGTQPRSGYRASIICFSGRGTWAETDIRSALGGTAKYASGDDVYGPVTVGVSIETQSEDGTGRRGRMVVLGSGSFMADGQNELLGNADLTKKLLVWLSPQDVLPGLAAEKTRRSDPVPIRMTEAQSRLFFWSLVVLLPALFMVAGISVFFQKRLLH